MKGLKACPFRHYVSNRTGLNLEKDLDTSECRTEDCKSCGWNPSVEEARKEKIRKADWNHKAVLVDTGNGEMIRKGDDVLTRVMAGRLSAKSLRYICTAPKEV